MKKTNSKGYLYYFFAIAANVIYGTVGFAFNLAACFDVGIVQGEQPGHMLTGIFTLAGIALISAAINVGLYFILRNRVYDAYKLRCFQIIFAVAPYVALLMVISV